jgi:hypothetical protein
MYPSIRDLLLWMVWLKYFRRDFILETLHPLQDKNDVERLNRPVRGDENTILRVNSLHIGHTEKISGTATTSTLKLAHTQTHICIQIYTRCPD